MSEDALERPATISTKQRTDPFEGVPPGCGTPRPWWPFYLALVGFAVWVSALLVLLTIRFRTSVV
jgi:hypothetical protein